MPAERSTVPGLYVGTSGWSYPTWKPGFYPPGTPQSEFLRFYAERFDTVELNTTGYRLPEEERFRRWAAEVPEGFRFAVKMPHPNRLVPFAEHVRALDLRHESWAGAPTGHAAVVDALDGDARFRYVRLREPPYDEASLRAWADRLRPLLDQGLEVYVYVKHEDEPHAPRYAQRLVELLG